MDDREKLVELCEDLETLPCCDTYEGQAEYLIATVDAVPVVRCKDCKWLYDEMDDYCCRSHRGLVRICENSFCSYGERKDGDDND